jgi:hypothetical protein
MYDKLSDLIGKTLTKAHVEGGALRFEASDGSTYELRGDDDCCNSPAAVEDVCGDLADLIGVPLVQAEEVSSGDTPEKPPEGTQESYTWSFYKFGTVKGRVTVRFLGSSSGYYSETASFHRTAPVAVNKKADAERTALTAGEEQPHV